MLKFIYIALVMVAGIYGADAILYWSIPLNVIVICHYGGQLIGKGLEKIGTKLNL